MFYDNLLLNKKNFTKLTAFKKNRKLPASFIFHGNNGVGKEAHAIEFFALLNCDLNEKFACNKCDSCIKLKKLQHEYLNLIIPLPKNNAISKHDSPLKALNSKQIDILDKLLFLKGSNPYSEVKLESANTILVNSIRDIKKNINLSIPNNKTKLHLIFNAEKLCFPNTESANALLKILEEPPPNNLFILITSDLSKIIETITSRCVSIYFPKIKKNKVQEFIIQNNVDKEKANIISCISSGSIKYALKLSEDFDSNMEVLNNLIDINLNDDLSNIEHVFPFFKNKEDSIYILNLYNHFFNDLIIYKMHETLSYSKLENKIIKMIDKYSMADFNKCITVINNTQNYISKNGNIILMITALLIEISCILNSKYYNINHLEELLNYPN